MKTTFFLVTLYMVFGFFACKRDDDKAIGKGGAAKSAHNTRIIAHATGK